jgi:hypothetical protein
MIRQRASRQRRPHIAALFSIILAVLTEVCGTGCAHTTDDKLRRQFVAHEAEFQQLLAAVNEDAGLTSLGEDVLIYDGRSVARPRIHDVEEMGLSAKRWQMYDTQRRRLQLVQISRGVNGAVEFRVDPGSLFNGDSSKGYVYLPGMPTRLEPSLDRYRARASDRNRGGNITVYTHLKRNWFLYLHIPG